MHSDWTLLRHQLFFGTYDQSAITIYKGTSDKFAAWNSEIPEVGRWELSIYLSTPEAWRTDGAKRTLAKRYQLHVKTGLGEEAIEFDAAEAEEGWNSLGMFRIEEAGESVTVKLMADPEYLVVADAVRWKKIK